MKERAGKQVNGKASEAVGKAAGKARGKKRKADDQGEKSSGSGSSGSSSNSSDDSSNSGEEKDGKVSEVGSTTVGAASAATGTTGTTGTTSSAVGNSSASRPAKSSAPSVAGGEPAPAAAAERQPAPSPQASPRERLRSSTLPKLSVTIGATQLFVLQDRVAEEERSAKKGRSDAGSVVDDEDLSSFKKPGKSLHPDYWCRKMRLQQLLEGGLDNRDLLQANLAVTRCTTKGSPEEKAGGERLRKHLRNCTLADSLSPGKILQITDEEMRNAIQVQSM